MSCTKAQGFLEKNDVEVESMADARKETKGRKEALALARAASKVIVSRGKKTVTFDMKKNPPDDDTLAEHVLGPTGNLRAPALRKGSTLYIGFNEDVYRKLLDV
jgi:arsenate reductase-like glutaredoxin family protein